MEYFSVIRLAMSVFEDYDTAAVGYDNGRVADGVEGMVMMLSGLLKKPLKEVLLQTKSCFGFFLGFVDLKTYS